MDVAQGSLYTVIGLGVLAFQQAQVQRRELVKALQPLREAFDERVKQAESQLDAAIGEDL